MSDHAHAIVVQASQEVLRPVSRTVDHHDDLPDALDTEHVGKIEPDRRRSVVRRDDDRYVRAPVPHAPTVAIEPAEP